MVERPSMPDILLPGDVILTRGRGIIDFVIRLGQAIARGSLRPSPYSHAAICTGPWTVMDADILRNIANRPLDKWLEDVSYQDAVIFRRPAPTTFSEVQATNDSVRVSYEDDPTYIALERSQSHNFNLAQMALYFLGTKYNWLFLRSKAPSSSRRSFFCSEYIMTVMSKNDPHNFKDRPEKTLPIDLPGIFDRAGWTAKKLQDLYVAPKAVPRSFKPAEEKSEAFKQFLKEHPDIAAMQAQLEQPNNLLFEMQESMKRSAKIAIESEAHQLAAAKQVNELFREVRKYYSMLTRSIMDAKDRGEVRAALISAGMHIDMRGMPPVLDWLTAELRISPPKADVFLEELEGTEAERIKLTKLQLSIQSIRVSFLLEDIERVTSQCRDIGKGPPDEKLEPLFKELSTFLTSHPYLIEIDDSFEALFEQKLTACIDAIFEATAGLPQQDTRKPERELLDQLKRTILVFPVARLYRTLAKKLAPSTEYVGGSDANPV
jgi:hypothetical protein